MFRMTGLLLFELPRPQSLAVLFFPLLRCARSHPGRIRPVPIIPLSSFSLVFSSRASDTQLSLGKPGEETAYLIYSGHVAHGDSSTRIWRRVTE